MLAEPSSGSYNTTYFPDGLPAGTGTGAWSSSDAVTHTRPVNCTLWRTVSLAKRSSFCCKSPETLTAPAGPRMSVRPARRTWREMILAARQRSYSRFDSSPVASGCSRSCSMMKRSIVMTDVGDCERAMTRDGEGDRALLICAEHGDAMSSQPRQRLGRGMPVTVSRPDADNGLGRVQLVQPAVGRRATRAVMPDLQQRHRPDLAREMRFGRNAGVTREEQSRAAEADEQHDRFLVDVRLADRPRRVRTQHLDRDAV